MSNSINRGVKYVSLGLLVALLLALVVLLLALLYTSYNFSMSLPKATATMEAIAAKAESALAAAQIVEAKVGTQADAMKTSIASAETAVAAAETAVAAAETAVAPTTTPNQAPTGPKIPLDYGVSIAYQAADDYGKVLYSVDNWMAYPDYAAFVTGWEDHLDSPATVQFALIETQPGSEEWHLFYAKPIAAGTEATPTATGWSEYTLSAELYLAGTEEGSTEGEPSLVADGLVFDEGPEQKIVASTPFTVTAEPDATTLDSLLDLTDAVEGGEATLENSASRLLLADDSAGEEPKYTLILLFPQVTGAERDPARYWCCFWCWYNSCYLYPCCGW